MTSQAPTPVPPDTLLCHPIDPARAAPLRPAADDRAFMDAVSGRHAYRCLPLAAANTAGWELLCPTGVTLSWTGGAENEDLRIEHDDPAHAGFAAAHFKSGIVTFHPGWLFRTPPGVSLWALGSPNHLKHGIQALNGLIETDWLPYPFTMNWAMTAPGRVRFEKDEPFCFITLAGIDALAATQPLIAPMSDDPAFAAQYDAWRQDREALNALLAAGDPEAVKTPWRRRYFLGQHPPGCPAAAAAGHRNKLRLKAPKSGRRIEV